jgi:hypothetical protein
MCREIVWICREIVWICREIVWDVLKNPPSIPTYGKILRRGGAPFGLSSVAYRRWGADPPAEPPLVYRTKFPPLGGGPPGGAPFGLSSVAYRRWGADPPAFITRFIIVLVMYNIIRSRSRSLSPSLVL